MIKLQVFGIVKECCTQLKWVEFLFLKRPTERKEKAPNAETGEATWVESLGKQLFIDPLAPCRFLFSRCRCLPVSEPASECRRCILAPTPPCMGQPEARSVTRPHRNNLVEINLDCCGAWILNRSCIWQNSTRTADLGLWTVDRFGLDCS